jgi:hypothetical protein
MIEFLQNWLSSRGSIGLGADALDFFGSVLGWALAVWAWYRARIHHDHRKLRDLEKTAGKEHERVEGLKVDWLRTVADFRLANYHRNDFMEKLPDRAVEQISRPIENSESQAAAMLEQWWASERTAIAEINGQLGEWYGLFAINIGSLSSANGDKGNSERARALALRHLLIAAAIDPERSDWAALAEELETEQALHDIAQGDLPTQSFYLPAGLSKQEARLQAEALNDLAWKRFQKGAYWDCYLLADRASLIVARSLSANDPLVFEISSNKVYALDQAGHSARALSIALPTWEARRGHPDLGERHPSTLSSARLLARILSSACRNDEALQIIEPVCRELRSSRNIGPSHQYTLNADYVHGLILFRQGRSEEARAIAEEAYALAKGVFAPTHRLLADLAQLLAEMEGSSTPQKRLPENTAAPA